MLDNFTEIILFYVSTLCDFLMSEPIIYFVCALLSLFVVRVLRELLHITN